MRIGIFGGTFDPIHTGHLAIAQTAINEIPLQRVLFIPANIPPHKLKQPISPPQVRLEMVQLAVADHPQFEVSTVELEREGPSYMVDTLRLLQQRYPGAEFFLIIGADNLLGFQTWHEHEAILQLCRLAVYPRYESDLEQAPAELLRRSIVFKAPRMEISSSYIRGLVRQGKSVRYLVPDVVAEFIQQKRLYAARKPVVMQHKKNK